MRLKKPAAIAGVASLVAASTLLIAAPAHAETQVDNLTFYAEADFGQEDAGYPSGVDWFFGDYGVAQGTVVFTDFGLQPQEDGKQQILSEITTQPLDAIEVLELIDDLGVVEDDTNVDGGLWTFQLPLFGDGTSEFTTLRPSAPGDFDSSDTWITSGPIIGAGSVGTPDFAAGDSALLEDLLDALYDYGTPTILAYGLQFEELDSPVIRAISKWGTDNEWSVFIPEPPTRSVSPVELTESETTEDGVTFTGTGWMPEGAEANEENRPYYLDVFLCVEGNSDNDVSEEATMTVDIQSSGIITIHLVWDEPLEPGEYCAVFDDNTFYYTLLDSWSDEDPFFAFEVVEDELAATGADPMSGMITAAGLMGVGAIALMIVTARRRHLVG